MLGGIAIVFALFSIPVAVMVSGAAASAIFGEVSYRDGKRRFPDSELTDLPD